MKELADEAPMDQKPHFDSMLEWTRTASERPNIDSQMQLGSVIAACASKLKRTREAASVGSATAAQLAEALKENESLKAEMANKVRRENELTSSLAEMTSNGEALQKKLEAAGALSEKFDFSKASAREEEPPTESAANDVTAKVKKENASRLASLPVVSPIDALTSFLSSASTGATNRFTPAAGNHQILGSGGEMSFAGAIRPM